MPYIIVPFAKSVVDLEIEKGEGGSGNGAHKCAQNFWGTMPTSGHMSAFCTTVLLRTGVRGTCLLVTGLSYLILLPDRSLYPRWLRDLTALVEGCTIASCMYYM